jgi:hypothetical protein
MDNQELKNRILKGILYFKTIPPSKCNAGTFLLVKKLNSLMEEYLTGGEQKSLEDVAKENMDLK